MNQVPEPHDKMEYYNCQHQLCPKSHKYESQIVFAYCIEQLIVNFSATPGYMTPASFMKVIEQQF